MFINLSMSNTAPGLFISKKLCLKKLACWNIFRKLLLRCSCIWSSLFCWFGIWRCYLTVNTMATGKMRICGFFWPQNDET